MTKDEELRQAEAAKRILDDPVTIKAFETLRTAIAEQLWNNAVHRNASDTERARLDALAWSCDHFKNCLTLMVSGGEIIKNELLMAENVKAKVNSFNMRNVRYGTTN